MGGLCGLLVGLVYLVASRVLRQIEKGVNGGRLRRHLAKSCNQQLVSGITL